MWFGTNFTARSAWTSLQHWMEHSGECNRLRHSLLTSKPRIYVGGLLTFCFIVCATWKAHVEDINCVGVCLHSASSCTLLEGVRRCTWRTLLLEFASCKSLFSVLRIYLVSWGNFLISRTETGLITFFESDMLTYVKFASEMKLMIQIILYFQLFCTYNFHIYVSCWFRLELFIIIILFCMRNSYLICLVNNKFNVLEICASFQNINEIFLGLYVALFFT